jgi:hypothetical protein
MHDAPLKVLSKILFVVRHEWLWIPERAGAEIPKLAEPIPVARLVRKMCVYIP